MHFQVLAVVVSSELWVLHVIQVFIVILHDNKTVKQNNNKAFPSGNKEEID